MAGLYDSNGTEGNIEWQVEQTKEREFEVRVKKGDLIKEECYKCEYPTMFGIDVFDLGEINKKLDEMINEVDNIVGGNHEISDI